MPELTCCHLGDRVDDEPPIVIPVPPSMPIGDIAGSQLFSFDNTWFMLSPAASRHDCEWTGLPIDGGGSPPGPGGTIGISFQDLTVFFVNMSMRGGGQLSFVDRGSDRGRSRLPDVRRSGDTGTASPGQGTFPVTTTPDVLAADAGLEAIVPTALWKDCRLQTVAEPAALQTAVCLPSGGMPDRWQISSYPTARPSVTPTKEPPQRPCH